MRWSELIEDRHPISLECDALVQSAHARGINLALYFYKGQLVIKWIGRNIGGREAAKGTAAPVMREICALADRHGLKTVLDVSGGEPKLLDYYRSFGFVLQKSKRRDEEGDDYDGPWIMGRKPQATLPNRAGLIEGAEYPQLSLETRHRTHQDFSFVDVYGFGTFRFDMGWAVIAYIRVPEADRRGGLGRKAVEAVERQALEYGLTEVRGEALEGSEEFWRRLGYSFQQGEGQRPLISKKLDQPVSEGKKRRKRKVVHPVYGWYGWNGSDGSGDGGGMSESLSSDPSSWSQDKLLDYTKGWSIVVHGDPPEAGMPADRYEWHYDPAYPLDRIACGPWDEWMKEEIKMWAEEGQPDRYDDMFDRPIEEPIVITQVNGQGWLWDGCHRVGASVLQGLKTIPAIVGRPK